MISTSGNGLFNFESSSSFVFASLTSHEFFSRIRKRPFRVTSCPSAISIRGRDDRVDGIVRSSVSPITLLLPILLPADRGTRNVRGEEGSSICFRFDRRNEDRRVF